MTGVWAKWEGVVIDGAFPLRRFLGRSSHSVVFLTEYGAQNLTNAAIKLIPADPATEEAQLSRWKAIATLSHPHLVRIFASGRCRLGGHPFLFVVMEYAEQTLAQLLLNRPLTPDEVREMLLPVLEALAFLNGRNWVQSQVKPPNVLVVNDRLKVASDNARPVGDAVARVAKPSAYDAPEVRERGASIAGDVWGVGATMVEALTQAPPTWPDERRETAFFPAIVPPEFVDIVRRCLSRYPGNRPTIIVLEADVNRTASAGTAHAMAEGGITEPGRPALATGADPVQVRATVGSATVVTEAAVSEGAADEVAVREVAAYEVAVREAAARAVAIPTLAAPKAPVSEFGVAESAMKWMVAAKAGITQFAGRTADIVWPLKQPRFVLGIAAGAAVSMAVAWGCWHLLGRSHTDPAVSKIPQSFLPPMAAPQVAAQSANPATASMPAAPPPAVLHQVIPEISRHARESIRGRIKVVVRVTVDRSGNVVGEKLVNSGSSRYFARQATEAAGKWKFAAADKQGAREGLLRFEFTRAGTTGQVVVPPT